MKMMKAPLTGAFLFCSYNSDETVVSNWKTCGLLF